jgi:hypothetical protein
MGNCQASFSTFAKRRIARVTNLHKQGVGFLAIRSGIITGRPLDLLYRTEHGRWIVVPHDIEAALLSSQSELQAMALLRSKTVTE